MSGRTTWAAYAEYSVMPAGGAKGLGEVARERLGPQVRSMYGCGQPENSEVCRARLLVDFGRCLAEEEVISAMRLGMPEWLVPVLEVAPAEEGMRNEWLVARQWLVWEHCKGGAKGAIGGPFVGGGETNMRWYADGECDG
jgi:hypothetical protein